MQNLGLSPRVVVIGSSIESIDALARLLKQLPSTFPLPVVAHLHGLQATSMKRLTGAKWHFASKLKLVDAQDGDHIYAGCIYVISSKIQLAFVNVDVLGIVSGSATSGIDCLFESAARWYRSGVIGVVLSGLGTDGTQGLRAITKVDGIRVVQSPFESAFPSMPVNALIGDDVQYAVMLDQMGALIADLVAEPESVKVVASEVQAEVARLVLATTENLAKSLDRSIEDILRLIRHDMSMDITFITKLSSDDVVVIHATVDKGGVRIQGMSHPQHQSLCQRVLDGRLPAVMPDVDALRSTHDVPVLPIAIGAYIATPVWLKNGTLYGMLCCLRSTVARELDQLHYRRMQMSAQQIANLIDETKEF